MDKGLNIAIGEFITFSADVEIKNLVLHAPHGDYIADDEDEDE